MMSYLNSGNDIMNYFAKFEKFLPHSIIIPSFYEYRKSNARVRRGGGGAYKIGSQNTPYKLGLTSACTSQMILLSGVVLIHEHSQEAQSVLPKTQIILWLMETT